MHYYQLDHISQQWGLWFEDKETLKQPFYRVYGHFGEQNNCPYCFSELQIYRGENYKKRESEYLKICPICGWWRILRRFWHEGDELETLPVMSKVKISGYYYKVMLILEMLCNNKNMILNEGIRAREVRLVSKKDSRIISTGEALELAVQQDMDLVMISPPVLPTACKILDYSKNRL